ncbi:TetR/AcrR family transcriptional regulator [Methanospirillum purgamenti]|jgi:AcrR family transcriptional regulator|uniref:TetR/AcrR family transcriptional regulator n=1 Tax=Methanospirillum hungatei TaxID=2203 RepID=A0A8F5VMH0_METHU|nr:TetR/AcrR family transcriptional regulator [Methanospirillum hungatei]QXO94222.1 TetR/AcrR family transcriptional regulator [Methanospirillum hungatei]
MATADRRQREREQRRVEIIDVAEKLFYEKGFDNVSMDEIAEAVEISKGSLYLLFKNKDSLYFEIVSRVHREYHRQLMEKIDATATGGDQIRTMIKFLVEFTKNHRDYNTMSCTYGPVIYSRLDEAYDQILAQNAVEFNRWQHNAIRKGMDDGSIRKDLDPILLGIYISLISISVVSPHPIWEKGFQMAGIGYEQLVDNFLTFIEPSINHCGKNS